MIMQTLRRAIGPGILAIVGLVTGCASTASNVEPPSPPARPLVAVRQDIVTLTRQLETMLAVNSSITADRAVDAATRQSFTRELRTTEQLVSKARGDARELKERAAEFLVAWGPQSSTFRTDDGRFASASNQPRSQSKAKYDEMVDDLLAAQDVLTPLLANLQQIDQQLGQRSSQPIPSLRDSVRSAATNGQIVISHLREALADMDELTRLLEAAGVRPPAPDGQ